MLPYVMDAGAQRRLEAYMSKIGDVLGDARRRASFATYAMGLWGDGERKSVEPIAARACADPHRTDAAHQRLLHFISSSPWSDQEVRRVAARYGVDALAAREPIIGWVLDDTGFLKQGTHSVGVQRQYTGSAGKVTNCQVGVSLSVITRTEHLPIDFDLYLPHSWADDPARRREARIPDEVQFQTKPEQAIALLRRAEAAGVPPGTVLADSAYGHSGRLRRTCRELGLPYAVGIMATDRAYRLDRLGRCIGEPMAVEHFAIGLMDGGFRRTTWREGTKEKLWSRFAMERVVMVQGDGVEDREEVWLLMEWKPGEPAPSDYFVVSLPPSATRREVVRMAKQRWRTERVYEDLKGELGLDHFEGRRFRGWHHHVTIALVCFAFVVAERVGAFPPSAREEDRDRTHRRSTGAALRRLVHHRASRDRARRRHLAPALPALPPSSDANPFTMGTSWCSCRCAEENYP
ncbi:MAG: IS701 family transposase [Vicinamibacterales bacterium]